mgnify:CR=1 FL=1
MLALPSGAGTSHNTTVREIFRRISPDARVLDLGCAHGSFPVQDCSATVIRCDLNSVAGQRPACFVRGDACALPFAAGSFDAVILNHSLEHFRDLSAALTEVGRVLRPPAYLWIAVPDASTITDRIYRWLGRGGGHLNQFRDVIALVRLVEARTKLPHAGTRVLFTSFSFLNRNNNRGKKPRRIYLLGGGAEWTLRWATGLLRLLDRWLDTRTSIYGWACCFGPIPEFDPRPWSNVCVRCGSGHPSGFLKTEGRVRRGRLGGRVYDCPGCGAKNCFTDDRFYEEVR